MFNSFFSKKSKFDADNKAKEVSDMFKNFSSEIQDSIDPERLDKAFREFVNKGEALHEWLSNCGDLDELIENLDDVIKDPRVVTGQISLHLLAPVWLQFMESIALAMSLFNGSLNALIPIAIPTDCTAEKHMETINKALADLAIKLPRFIEDIPKIIAVNERTIKRHLEATEQIMELGNNKE